MFYQVFGGRGVTGGNRGPGARGLMDEHRKQQGIFRRGLVGGGVAPPPNPSLFFYMFKRKTSKPFYHKGIFLSNLANNLVVKRF